MKLVVVSVGRLRPPYVDDVQHYKKLLARHARLDLIEVREDESVARRLPERAFISLLAVDGRTYDSVAFSRWLEERRQSGRDLCFVVGGCAETAVAPAYLTFALPERLDFTQGASPAERSSWLASTVIRRCGPATSRIDGWRQARRAPAERGERCLTRH